MLNPPCGFVQPADLSNLQICPLPDFATAGFCHLRILYLDEDGENVLLSLKILYCSVFGWWLGCLCELWFCDYSSGIWGDLRSIFIGPIGRCCVFLGVVTNCRVRAAALVVATVLMFFIINSWLSSNFWKPLLFCFLA
jgi:hypothetical protein